MTTTIETNGRLLGLGSVTSGRARTSLRGATATWTATPVPAGQECVLMAMPAVTVDPSDHRSAVDAVAVVIEQDAFRGGPGTSAWSPPT